MNLTLGLMLDEGAYAPEKGHSADAGYDLRTKDRVVIHRGSSAVIDTGVHIQIPEGWFGKLESKSGLNVNHSIVSLGGVIDSGYTGSIRAKLYNFGDNDYIFHPGDKVVQIVFHRHESPDFAVVDGFEETDRGNNGFGSTGR